MNTTVTIDGIGLNCRLDGPEGAPWLVFSNSLMTDLSLWDAQVAAFAGQYRILRYDQRGHGGSAVPPGDCHFDTLSDDLAALMAHFGVTDATVVGVSMGGVTTLGLAARHPDLVARVAICDCQPVSNPAGAAAWDERIAIARDGGMAKLAGATTGRWFRPDTLAANPPTVDQVRTMIATTPVDGFVRAARALQNYDYRPHLAALTIPTLFVVGENDAALPQAMRGMADACPGSTLTVIPNCGHIPNVERPDTFNAALTALLAIPPWPELTQCV